MFNIIVDKNHDGSFGVGLELYGHKHMITFSRHFHVLLVFGFWFLELQIGNDVPSQPVGGKNGRK